MHAPRPAQAARLLRLAASFGFGVVQLDVTIVNVALPSLGRGFAAGVETLQWIVDAYTLVFAVLLLSTGALGDRYGAPGDRYGAPGGPTLRASRCSPWPRRPAASPRPRESSSQPRLLLLAAAALSAAWVEKSPDRSGR